MPFTGFPQSLSAMVLYYRTDLFKEHGIAPEDIATWDDFVDKGRELAKKKSSAHRSGSHLF